MNESPFPVFAIVGQPNNGKTTVMSTLAEEDSAEISPVPGTTLRCRDYSVMIDGTEVIRFVDTPGFEEAPAALEWFQKNAGKHQNSAAAFINAHASPGMFPRECEILRPIAEHAVVIYVIDGSIPLCETNRMEMQVLQLVGNPRVAVINSKEADTDSMESWKPTLNQMFNGYHLFNGHRATFADRIELLESIKGQFPPWRPQLEKAIVGLKRDWQSRLNKAADSICDLLTAVMTAKERVPIGNDVEEAVLKAQEKFRKTVMAEEERYRAGIRKLFRHNLANWNLPEHSLLGDDLFSDRVWKIFGLSKLQLALVSAFLFGGFGAWVDAHVGGASFMLGMVIGAGTGALVGYLGASQGISITIPGFKIGPLRLPKWKMRAGQKYAEARARPQSNLPWVLIDRALMYFQLASSWSHGRQERLIQPDLNAPEFQQVATRHWKKKSRDLVARFLKHSRTGANPRKREAAQKELWQFLHGIFGRLTGHEMPSESSAGEENSEKDDD